MWMKQAVWDGESMCSSPVRLIMTDVPNNGRSGALLPQWSPSTWSLKNICELSQLSLCPWIGGKTPATPPSLIIHTAPECFSISKCGSVPKYVMQNDNAKMTVALFCFVLGCASINNIPRMYKEGPGLTGKPELEQCFLVTLSQITEKLTNTKGRDERKRNKTVGGVGDSRRMFMPSQCQQWEMVIRIWLQTSNQTDEKLEWIQGENIHHHCWMDTNFSCPFLFYWTALYWMFC